MKRKKFYKLLISVLIKLSYDIDENYDNNIINRYEFYKLWDIIITARKEIEKTEESWLNYYGKK